MTGESPDTARRVPVRPDLEGLAPYGAPQIDVPVRLNTNETAEPPPARFTEALAQRLADLHLHRYPDRPATELRARLGAVHGLGHTQVWVANGSNEVLHQLFLAYGGPQRRAVTSRPGYSMYPVLAQVSMTPLTEVDLPDDFIVTPDVAHRLAAADGDLTVLASPNNPTGVVVPLESVRALHDRARGLVVIDEAYIEFGGVSSVSLIGELERLVVVRTFSKAFRLAGLRLGYLYAQPWVIDDLRRVRLPYHVDSIKQAAGLVALELRDEFLEHRARVASERDRVASSLQAIRGVEVFPSVANFLLFRVAEPLGVFEGLLERGVLVRDFSSKPRLAGCLRVTIGTAAENDRFLAAIAEVQESIVG